MQMYIDRIKYGFPFPNFIWQRKGKYFLRLAGINVSRSGNSLVMEPLYEPLLELYSQGGMAMFTLRLKKGKHLGIFMMRVHPYIYVEITDSTMEYMDEED